MANTIALQGRGDAKAWCQRAEGLNHRTEELLKKVGETLKSIEEFADGTIIDELVTFGNRVCTAATKVMEVMQQILNVVNDLLDKIGEFAENVVKTVADVAGKILGV